MLTIEDLTFEYPGLRAVDRLSLTIPRGAIAALVGPNGAGKTTLMRRIAALETPMWGRVRLGDLDVHAQPRRAHGHMGYLPDFFGLYDELTVRANLAYRAAAQKVPGAERAARIDRAAALLDLTARMEQKAGALSRGLRQRLAIALAILHGPDFLLLDEPASGLDPQARWVLARVLRQLRAEGMTLMVSSHILSELEDYSTHLAIMRDGRLVEFRALAAGGAEDADRAGDGRVALTVGFAAPAGPIAPALEGITGLELVAGEAHEARLVAADDSALHGEILRRLVEAGFAVCRFETGRARLQDSYLARLAGTTATPGAGAKAGDEDGAGDEDAKAGVAGGPAVPQARGGP